MGDQSFQINGVRDISCNRVQFRPAAQQNPVKNKQYNRQDILFGIFFSEKMIIIPQKKINKHCRYHSDIDENKNGLKISRISNSLHTGF